MIVARAPLRISFGGGGTDLPAYYERFGGMVVSAAIRPACHVRLNAHQGESVVVQSHDYRCTITVPARQPVVPREPLSLPRAVLRWFAERGLFPAGIRIAMRSDVPPGSGLGSSSAMTVALVSAIARHINLPLTQRMAAEIACEIEIDLLAKPIGRQDQYASALGGINTLTFSTDGVVATPLRLEPTVVRSLQDHLLLVSTRQTRDSAKVLRSQQAATGADAEVTERLHCIKSIASAMHDALLAGDLPGFGALLHESWQVKRGLSEDVTSPEIDRWYEIAREHGAYGGKITGAGGGGFFLFCVPPRRRAAVGAALCSAGLAAFPFTFDRQGSVALGEIVVLTPADSVSKGSSYETVNASHP